MLAGERFSMDAREKEILREAELYVRELFSGETSGHDADHTFRVARIAARLAES